MIKDIYAIFLREIRRTFAEKFELIFSIVWPIILIFFLGFGGESFFTSDKFGIGYTELLGPGIIAFFAMGGAISVGNSLIEDKKGFLKELLVSPISRASIFLGKVFGEMLINMGLLLIVILVFLIYLGGISFMSIILSMIFVLLIAFGFYGFGIIVASLFKKAKHYQLISGILFSGIVFLSGVLFPLTNFPRAVRFLSIINPLTYGVDGLRNVMVNYGEFSLILDLAVLLAFAFLTIFIGAYLFGRSLKK